MAQNCQLHAFDRMGSIPQSAGMGGEHEISIGLHSTRAIRRRDRSDRGLWIESSSRWQMETAGRRNTDQWHSGKHHSGIPVQMQHRGMCWQVIAEGVGRTCANLTLQSEQGM
jgi:hypothetical protein